MDENDNVHVSLAVEGEPREPNSSHGSSGTDTETRFVFSNLKQSNEKLFRTLLRRLETVESAMECAGRQSAVELFQRENPIQGG